MSVRWWLCGLLRYEQLRVHLFAHCWIMKSVVSDFRGAQAGYCSYNITGLQEQKCNKSQCDSMLSHTISLYYPEISKEQGEYWKKSNFNKQVTAQQLCGFCVCGECHIQYQYIAYYNIQFYHETDGYNAMVNIYVKIVWCFIYFLFAMKMLNYYFNHRK